jgi:hypothetical protein
MELIDLREIVLKSLFILFISILNSREMRDKGRIVSRRRVKF